MLIPKSLRCSRLPNLPTNLSRKMAKNGQLRVFLIRCPRATFSLNGRHVIETSPNILYSQLSSLLNLAKREETNPLVKIQKRKKKEDPCKKGKN